MAVVCSFFKNSPCIFLLGLEEMLRMIEGSNLSTGFFEKESQNIS